MGFMAGKRQTNYMYVKVMKPLNNNSKLIGKILTVKEWVRQKTEEKRDPVYTHPVFLSQVFDGEQFVEIYCRNREEFQETFRKYEEKINEKTI